MFNAIKVKTRLATSALILLAVSAGASQTEMPKTISFGIIATDAQQKLRQNWEPLLNDFGKAVGIPVKVYFAPDYAGIVQAQRFGKVDFAYYGNKAAIESVDRANAEVFARYIDETGQQGYYSVLIVNAENDKLNNLQDVIAQHKSLKLGNGDPNSTSGFLVPNFEAFAKNGISAQDFKRTIIANHGANVMAVANNQVDIATNHTMALYRLQETNPTLYKKLKVVWQSSLIPSDVLTYRNDIPDELKKQAQTFFINYGKNGNPQEIDNLKGLAWSGFAPADNNQLLPIRQMELFKKRVETENNQNLSDQEKQSRISAIQADIDSIQAKIDALTP